MTLPSSTLIICSRNRPQLLQETIESVLQGIEVPREIVIVDQSETQNVHLTELKHERCQIRYIWTDTVGLCRARNVGVVSAAHEILVFIDDDMRVESDWYGTLINSFYEAGANTVITGKVLPGEAERPGGFVPALATGEQPQVYQGRINKDVLSAGHMLITRSILERIGPFDERLGAGSRFPSADDNDYGFRLLEASYRILYYPRAVVYHRAWRSAKEFFPMRWKYGRGKGGFYAKHIHLKDAFMLRRMSRDILVRLFRFPWRVLHRPRLALGDLVYVGGVFSGAIDWALTQ